MSPKRCTWTMHTSFLRVSRSSTQTTARVRSCSCLKAILGRICTQEISGLECGAPIVLHEGGVGVQSDVSVA